MVRFYLIALAVIILDQITKFLFTDKHFGIINYTTNTGAAFSILQNYAVLLTIITIIVIGFIIYLYKKNKNYYLPLSLIIGGAIGNLIDRLFFGFVRDFIDLKVWPIFNIADSANVIGAIILMIFIIKKK